MRNMWQSIGHARSLLFVPGHRPDRFDKAARSGADGVVIDLEDAVGPSLKLAARENVHQWFKEGREAVVRINGLNSPWHKEDLAMLDGSRCAIMLPKITEPDQVEIVLEQLAPGSCVIALLETSAAILNARDICALPGVVRAVFGNGDLGSSLGVEYADRAAMDYIRTSIVLASDAAGLAPPFDGGSMSLADEESLIEDAKYALAFGFTGKVCIHPSQVSIVNSLFTPSHDKIRWARDVIATEGDGSITVLNGTVIGKPIVERARRILARWESV